MPRVHHPARYRNLERVARLDPERDADEIGRITARLDFPWDYAQGTGIAFLRDFGVPSISRLLDATREFEDHGVKRYDDTILIGEEATIDGVDSARGHAAIRRLNRIHGHYDIPADEYAYVLATTVVGPVEWIRAYGWRDLHPHETEALARVTTRFGELMGLKGLPRSYDGYLALLRTYEAERFAPDPANRRVAEAALRAATRVAPWPVRPVVRRVTIALLDEPLRQALGLPRQPAWLGAAVRRALRLRARLLRLAPPRRTLHRHRPTTYPHGHTLGDLGPLAMLDDLARPPRGEGATA